MLKLNYKKRRRRDFHKYLGFNRPMVSISISNKNIAATLHDAKGKAIIGVSTIGQAELSSNIRSANLIGKNLSEKIQSLGITEVLFNKSGCKFHGKVRKISEALKKNGIKC